MSITYPCRVVRSVCVHSASDLSKSTNCGGSCPDIPGGHARGLLYRLMTRGNDGRNDILQGYALVSITACLTYGTARHRWGVMKINGDYSVLRL